MAEEVRIVIVEFQDEMFASKSYEHNKLSTGNLSAACRQNANKQKLSMMINGRPKVSLKATILFHAELCTQ